MDIEKKIKIILFDVYENNINIEEGYNKIKKLITINNFFNRYNTNNIYIQRKDDEQNNSILNSLTIANYYNNCLKIVKTFSNNNNKTGIEIEKTPYIDENEIEDNIQHLE